MKAILSSVTLVLFVSISASAATLDRIKAADCKSTQGSYLKLDRVAGTLEARFASLPVMSNAAGDELMPIDILKESDSVGIGALAVNMASNLFGSVMLVTKAGTEVSEQMTVKAVFRDMAGGVQQEDLLCTFAGI